MLKILITISSIIVLIISAFGLLTNNHDLLPYMFLFLSLSMLLLGLLEFKRNRRVGWILVSVFIVTFFVFITELF
ncbi:DUF3953 domain-containing protein [Alkalicoccobacillus porphyridii]|uniref:DUF3953 domain-containing protein n=1 Tax=Alkalicoccobacillus porphyridii TaxID=2597270 RepID=A0A554A2L7_9BACI|nr:DUF3953 domain-containing protein [Alkalicoccobacillus porphyridii]